MSGNNDDQGWDQPTQFRGELSSLIQVTKPDTNLQFPVLWLAQGTTLTPGPHFPLRSSVVTLGRDKSSTICIPDPLVSRAHAELHCSDNFSKVSIRSVKATNGTLVNDKPVLEMELNHGDYIKLGSTLFKFYAKGRAEHVMDAKVIAQYRRNDVLTGIANKLAFEESLQLRFDSAKLHKNNLSVLMMDIDFFKQINDNHGHVFGDFVLKAVAEVLKTSVKDWPGLVARYGGEEFVALIWGLPPNQVESMAETLRQKIESLSFTHSQAPNASVTVSIGVAHLADSTTAPTALLESADKALYQSKNSGRNRVTTSLSGS